MRGAASNGRPYRDRPERHQRAKMVVVKTPSEGKPSMGKSIPNLSSVTRVGLDLAKSVFQVHGVDASGRVVVTKAIRRNKLLELRQPRRLGRGGP